jgi:hypothetical protein
MWRKREYLNGLKINLRILLFEKFSAVYYIFLKPSTNSTQSVKTSEKGAWKYREGDS